MSARGVDETKRKVYTRGTRGGNEVVVTTTLTDSATWTQEASLHFVFHFTLIFPFYPIPRPLSIFPVILYTCIPTFFLFLSFFFFFSSTVNRESSMDERLN